MLPDPARLRARARYCIEAARQATNPRVRVYLSGRGFELAQCAEAVSRGADLGRAAPERKEAPMDDLLTIMAAHLRERAVHCREMARIATSVGIAEELRMIAKEYDDDAATVEAHVPTHTSGDYGSA